MKPKLLSKNIIIKIIAH